MSKPKKVPKKPVKAVKAPKKVPKKAKKPVAPPKNVEFKEGQTVKRIDVFRLFEDSTNIWNRWDKEKADWVKVPYKTEVKDLEFTIVRTEDCMGGFTMYWAESKNWKMRWMKRPNHSGWGFLTILSKDILKDN